MKPTINTQLVSSVAIIAFGVGVLGGAILNNIYILEYLSIGDQIQLEFDLVGILNLLVTILGVFIISRIYATKDGEERIEKDNLIGYFQVFEKDFTARMRELLTPAEVSLSLVVTTLRRHRMRADKLINLAQKHHFLADGSVFAHNLDARIKRIADLMTDTPQKGDVPNGVVISAGKLTFSERQIDAVVSAIFDVTSDTFELVTEINRCRR